MKRCLIFLLPALLALASCGTAAQYASDQLYPDGIYYRPQPPVQLYDEEDFRDMAARNLAADSLKTGSRPDPDYGYGYYSPYYYYSPYWSYRPYSWGLWGDPWWDPYFDPWWGYSSFGYYGYYGFYSPYSYYSYGYAPYYYHHPVYVSRPANYGASGYPGSYLTGGNNHRRAGSLGTGGTGVKPSSVTYRRSAGSSSSVRSSSSSSSSGYRRSGSSDYTPRSSSSSYSGSSSRSSYSGSSYSGGGYSGGGGGGGYSGGSSHSGGSGGGGGGRR